MLRIPQKPPSLTELVKNALESNRIKEILDFSMSQENASRYHHWDKIRRLGLPDGLLNHREWWLAIKLRRQPLIKTVPLTDQRKRPFIYVPTDPIPQRLHNIDLFGGQVPGLPEPITNRDTKDRYIINSLIEEAITSSQLEGAATTRQVAREMIRTGRRPVDRSERMIFNNFKTMQRIGSLRKEQLTKEVICELHRIVTTDTLDDPEVAGVVRSTDQKIDVGDDFGQVFHEPPPATELEERMESLCTFANNLSTDEFIHPVIRSIIVHFWLAYDHPFVDGNGRTARALFYWSMLHHDAYWLFEFISISEIILKGPSKYARAFLHTETDDNDLTYFILYHLDVIQRAFEQLWNYVTRKTDELRQLEQRLRSMQFLNHRQQALVGHALRHSNADYTIESHRASHGVVYETARSDLMDLQNLGLLESFKVGREWHFRRSADLEQRLANPTEQARRPGKSVAKRDFKE